MEFSDSEKIGASMGVTKNLGNFNSVRVDAWASREVKVGADREALWAEIWAEIEGQLEAQLDESGNG